MAAPVSNPSKDLFSAFELEWASPQMVWKQFVGEAHPNIPEQEWE
jgi:hypothetical protein